MTRQLFLQALFLTLLSVVLFRGAEAVSAQELKVTPKVIANLGEFRAEPKFQDGGIYHAPSEEVRVAAAAHLNALLDRLVSSIAAHPTKAFVLSEFRRTLTEFDGADSEDRDRLLGYLERIMDIVGIESSDGLLNNWRYGFDPTAKP
jgi:Domain of unknown function (DUF4844)